MEKIDRTVIGTGLRSIIATINELYREQKILAAERKCLLVGLRETLKDIHKGDSMTILRKIDEFVEPEIYKR